MTTLLLDTPPLACQLEARGRVVMVHAGAASGYISPCYNA
jgi:hypothetical protein